MVTMDPEPTSQKDKIKQLLDKWTAEVNHLHNLLDSDFFKDHEILDAHARTEWQTKSLMLVELENIILTKEEKRKSKLIVTV